MNVKRNMLREQEESGENNANENYHTKDTASAQEGNSMAHNKPN